MICKCDSVTLRRKKFSDFELVDPTTKEEANKIFLAGYVEGDDGERKNVKLYASSFINLKLGDVVTELDDEKQYDNLSVITDTYQESDIKLVSINYQGDVDFLQISKISDNLFSTIDGKKYLCIKLSANMPLGTVFRIYIPNFPVEKGVIIFPSADLTTADDTPIEVFYRPQEEEATPIDLYFTLIQLADTEKQEVSLKTKIIDVMNIKTD